MKVTYEYKISSTDYEEYDINLRVDYNTENDYDTTYYFFDGSEWQKDFIDLGKLSPKKEEDKNQFDDFITKVHDFMVHGNLWEQLKVMEDNEEIIKEQYALRIVAKKL